MNCSSVTTLMISSASHTSTASHRQQVLDESEWSANLQGQRVEALMMLLQGVAGPLQDSSCQLFRIFFSCS